MWSTARIVFLRAAEAGDPNAAVALGATYDPTVLARLGVVGMAADVEKARSWYQKAESLGSPEASAAATRLLRSTASVADLTFLPAASLGRNVKSKSR